VSAEGKEGKEKERGRTLGQELWAKRFGILSLLVPLARVYLGIHVLPTIPKEWEALIGVAILVVWVSGASLRRDKLDGLVNVLLCVWAFLLSFFTEF